MQNVLKLIYHYKYAYTEYFLIHAIKLLNSCDNINFAPYSNDKRRPVKIKSSYQFVPASDQAVLLVRSLIIEAIICSLGPLTGKLLV